MTFSGPVNAPEAQTPASYRLTLPGEKVSYSAECQGD